MNEDVKPIYRVRVLAFVFTLFYLTTLTSLFFVNSQITLVAIIRVIIGGLCLLNIRFQIIDLEIMCNCFYMSVIVITSLLIFGPTQLEVPRYFSMLGSLMQIGPLVAMYTSGEKISFTYASVNIIVMILSFIDSLNNPVLVDITLHSNAHFLFFGIVGQLIPISLFKIFDYEGKLYQRLLLKILHHSEKKSQSKTIFLSRMSHELRTPLHGLLSSINLLAQTKISVEQDSYIQTATSCSNMLSDLVMKILDISKIESGRFEVDIQQFRLFDLIQTMFESVSSTANQKGLELVIIFDDSDFEIAGDYFHIRQILLSVLENAVKFTEKGNVSLRTLRISNETLQFEIQDTGIGIEEDTLSAIFQPFAQAEGASYKKTDGAGLGLTLSKKFADSLGGKIEAKSTIGVGSLFVIELPFESIKPCFYSFPSYLNDSKIVVYSTSPTKSSISAYLKTARLNFQLMSNKEKDIFDFDYYIIDEDVELLERILGHIKKKDGETPYIQIIFLCSLSKFENLLKLHQVYVGYVQVLMKPILPFPFIDALKLMGSSSTNHPTHSPFHKKVVSLPPSKQDVPTLVSQPTKDSGSSTPLQVLVVEDNEICQMVMRKQLEKIGVQFEITPSGDECIKIWEQHYIHNGVPIPLIFMDIEIDGSMNGIETSQVIRKMEADLEIEGKNIPKSHIIVLTGRALEQDRQQAFSSGCDDFLVKPVHLKKIQDFVSNFASQKINS